MKIRVKFFEDINKNIFLNSNTVFVTIFFYILFVFICIISNNENLIIKSMLLIPIAIPKINFEEDADVESSPDGENANSEANQPAEEESIESEPEKKPTKKFGKKLFLGGGCGFLALIFLLMVLINMISAITQVAYATMLNSGDEETGEVAPNTQTTTDVTLFMVVEDFMERVKNFFSKGAFVSDGESFGEYGLNVELLKVKIIETKENFYKEKSIELDAGFLAAALYYDGQKSDAIDVNGNGIPDQNPKLENRLNYIEELVMLMMTVKERKYICKKENVEGNDQYYLQFVSAKDAEGTPEEIQQKMKNSVACSEETLTKNFDDPNNYIYDYSYEYDPNGFYDRFKKSDLIIKMYEEDYLKENQSTGKKLTDKDKEKIVTEMEMYYNLFKAFWGDITKTSNCVAVGNIPSSVLSYMRTPIDTPYRITSHYGNRTGVFAGFHKGTDVVAEENTTIYAAATGVVELISSDASSGNFIVLSHEIEDNTYYSVYRHLADGTIVVHQKQPVTIGDQIATMGATGETSGAHLHFELYKKDNLGNPNYYNPENIFSSATNYEYECAQDINIGSCSKEGAIAVYSNKKRYSFNLIRSIYMSQIDLFKDNTVMAANVDADKLKEILYSSKLVEANSIKEKINFVTKQVLYSDYWLPFTDPYRDAGPINEVVRLVGLIDNNAYNYAYMGISFIKGSNYGALGYKTAKEMYESFSTNKYNEIEGTINYAISSNYFLTNLFRTFDAGPEYIISGSETLSSIATKFNSTEAELRSGTNIDSVGIGVNKTIKFTNKEIAIRGIVKAMFVNNENIDINLVAASIFLKYYQKYQADLTSTIENYLNQCLIIEKPEWKDCDTFESHGKCLSNLSKYRAKTTELLNKAPTAIGKRVLLYALSLWGKVRYCGWCSVYNPTTGGGDKECKEDGIRYKKWSFSIRCKGGYQSWWHFAGFNPKWSQVHAYVFEGQSYVAGIAGLDCEGFVTWVMNQTFGVSQEYGNNFKSVKQSKGACRIDTDYTTAHIFGTNNFGKKEISKELKPGDGLCDYDDKAYNGQHVMIYMGFDDLDGDGVAGGSDKLYFVHSSGGDMGINVTWYSANNSYFNHHVSYYTYK